MFQSEQKITKVKKTINLNEIIEKTAELNELSKHGRHNQQSHAGGRRGRGSAPRDKNVSGGGAGKSTGGYGGGRLPAGGKGKKSLDRAKAKQKARSERQKVRSERATLKRNGTSKQKQAYDAVVMRGLPQGKGAVDMRLIQRRHADGMDAARKAGYKG